jgi:hypothetical protein
MNKDESEGFFFCFVRDGKRCSSVFDGEWQAHTNGNKKAQVFSRLITWNEKVKEREKRERTE